MPYENPYSCIVLLLEFPPSDGVLPPEARVINPFTTPIPSPTIPTGAISRSSSHQQRGIKRFWPHKSSYDVLHAGVDIRSSSSSRIATPRALSIDPRQFSDTQSVITDLKTPSNSPIDSNAPSSPRQELDGGVRLAGGPQSDRSESDVLPPAYAPYH